LWQAFGYLPLPLKMVIRQAAGYKSRRDLTRALKLIAAPT